MIFIQGFTLAQGKCDFGLGKNTFLQLGMVPFIGITYIRGKKNVILKLDANILCFVFCQEQFVNEIP